jgi:hypothetical protein
VPRPGDAPGGRRQDANESGCLGQLASLGALADLSGQWIDAVYKRRQPRAIVLDMDWSESPTYGQQEAAPTTPFSAAPVITRFLFNKLGDLEQCALRPGSVHSAEGWSRWSLATVAR